MRISVIIPAYNEEKYIGVCLQSIEDRRIADLKEVIVVDNASTDGTAAIAKKFPGVRVVSEPKKGTNNARQRGFLESTGDLLVFIDADTKIPEGWSEKIIKTFSERQDIVSLSGPYKYYDGPIFWRGIQNLLWWVSAPLSYRMVGYMILIGNFAVRRETLGAINGFDTAITFYGDDTDTARRLSKHGKVVFRMDFFIYSSMRRLLAEGIIRTNIRYALNFIWPVFFGKPFTHTNTDIRMNS